jgi:fatty-acyl-CoA synthase
MTQGWGMTEISPCGAIARLQRHHLQQTPDEQLKRRLVQGVPLPTLQMRLMGDNGKPTPCDGQSVGEIQVKGPFVVRRYYKDTTSTSFTEDGWLRTGDVGVWDEERYVRRSSLHILRSCAGFLLNNDVPLACRFG